MKTKKITILVLLALMIVSCNEVDKLLTFTISDQTTFKINSGLPFNSPFEVATPDVTTNSTSEFKNNNTNVDLVKDVKLDELKLSITSPADKTFSFLKSVHMYISTTADDEIELAFLDNISSTTNTINLTCTAQKLDKYIKASSYKIRTSVITKETLTQETTVKADMKFKVTADPF
ncbi:hypothetical protein C8C85_0636 [Flavobacterium sp. 103]|uniref:hypothetical protein n=1 Tax=unclassified Flavobacterium TaxID=196869 RepID=UPI000D5DF3D4|nr:MULTISPECIES: hypothetical protein [unclassified Flavobacterium]PVX44880.1 hypothetical protein C8C85_0636 [Flavobacterium sp. 103]QKJ62979.1 hypothetical protein HQN62_07480 [Flavobacterium sp. M31R6]